jgi:molecular chaperone DnaK
MGKIIGIDLGTTNSVVAVMERGQPKVIPNTKGSRLTPSMVAFDEGGKVLVGEAARRRVLVDPETTVVSAKRFIGLGANDPIVRRAPFKVVTAPGGDLAFEIFRVRHSPAEICARILTQLKRAADDYLGEPVTEAVISIPLSFNERQRQAIRDAGAIAGLEVKRIITEPIAVALAYGIRKTKERLIAVCSMGGGAFEVSILEVGDKVVESVAGCGDNHLGGDDLDHRLIDWLVGEFRKDTSIDVGADKKVIQRLREAAERAKLELSERQETEIHLPALTVDASGPKHLQKTLSRAMFENLIEDLVERTIVSCRRALADAGKKVTDLHAVVLAGGSTRIPRVAARLEEFFGRKADRSMNAVEAVALGAAIQAGILSGDLKDILLLDATSLSLAIEIAGGVAKVLIPRNTTIPTRKTELVSIPTAGHTAVSLHVIQGERPAAKDNTTIGRFQLIGLPSVPPGFLRPIEVTFDIDGNSVVHVAAKDKVTGLGETLRIGMPSAFGGDPRPAAAGTVSATLPRNAAARMTRNASKVVLVLGVIMLCWWLGPIGPVAVTAAAMIIVLRLPRRAASSKAPRGFGSSVIAAANDRQEAFAGFFLLMAACAGSILCGQILLDGRPAALWFLGTAAGAVTFHFLHPAKPALLRVVIANARNALIFAGIGLAGVVTMQLVLAYIHDGHLALAETWTQELTGARYALARVLFMKPWHLAAVLAALITMAVLLPSLHVMRNYRRLNLVASRALLTVTVASSFSFFGGQLARSHYSRWVAQIVSDAQSKLDEIDEANRSVVDLAAIEDVVHEISPNEQAHLRAVGLALGERPEHSDQEVVQRIAKRIVGTLTEPLHERIDFAVTHVADDLISPALRENRTVVERVRGDCDRGVPPSRADLSALDVERTRSRAAKGEAREATQQFLTNTFAQWIPGGPLVSALIVQLVTRVDGTDRGRAHPIDLATASAAIRGAPHPPRIYIDIPRITATGSTTNRTNTASGNPDESSHLGVSSTDATAINELVTTITNEVAEERRQEAERAREAERVRQERWQEAERAREAERVRQEVRPYEVDRPYENHRPYDGERPHESYRPHENYRPHESYHPHSVSGGHGH